VRQRYLAALGLAEEATLEEIKSAFRKLAAEMHPDKHRGQGRAAEQRAAKRFQKISEAYHWLIANKEAA
jgi:DnaJ-class molecular chaperone